MKRLPRGPAGLARPHAERGSCGFGLIAQMDGEPSHELVSTAVTALGRMTHRGAIAADGKTGDGCGLLLARPEGFLRAAARESGIALGNRFAAGSVFLDPDPSQARAARETLARELSARGLAVAGWREVPVDPAACGEQALAARPRIEQVFVNAPAGLEDEAFERALFVARRRAQQALAATDPVFYVASLAARTLSYKGLVMPANLPVFYPDLQRPDLQAHLCVFHQRFSTNTLPQWRLAQPFRMLAHNGEINTIQGNRNWCLARAPRMRTPHFDIAEVLPLVEHADSDSCSLDNMLEALVAAGLDLFHAVAMLIPAAWQNVEALDPDLRAFFEYHSHHMEPWDGPAGIVFSDGRHAACALDRNGLRPARWVITRDRQITLASEIGVWDYPPEAVLRKGRLKPGQLLAVDTQTGELLLPRQIGDRLKTRQPYRAWLRRYAVRIEEGAEEDADSDRLDARERAFHYKMFGVSHEELEQVVRVLAETGQEPTGSMGDDTPLAVLSLRPRSLYDAFRQQFAQVTNPPIDPLREQVVMSLETVFGPEHNPLEERPEHARRAVADSPVLSAGKFRRLLALEAEGWPHRDLRLAYPAERGLRAALEALCDRAEAAVRDGAAFLVLSDRGVGAGELPIHALLATGAVHHRLIARGLRCAADLVIETATARDPHHFAVLIGYGATAVYPYLAYAGIEEFAGAGSPALEELRARYRRGINKGLYKILSKMGISTIASYRGAQLFEAVGLHEEVIGLCFAGTTSRLQGACFEDLEAEQRLLAREARSPHRAAQVGGLLKFVHGGEQHAWNPDVVDALRRAAASGEPADYRRFAALVNGRSPLALRDLLALRLAERPVPLAEVEPSEAIYPRFDSAAMSLGALSPEAHEALATAMNRLGGRSNSGEGGEDPVRFGTERTSRIKQVASGRFGVTPAYLVNAEVLQIKIAQGAKPGEGGQLPGHKVNELIARLRYSRPGVALISPPPHHDIYSIEDLAQLIFDLKQVNPEALVSVKLVAEAGVGTIAAGVAKAYADLITIAGHDGGTGASPLSSVKYAGSPWELGLAETRQVLRANDLRGRVRLQADGGLKTGLDVVKAALLGAESFGFGTAPMIALGCKYLRVCHLNNCATGIATQHQALRSEHFRGTVEGVMNYFRGVAEEVRELLAALGARSLAEIVGRTELLEPRAGLGTKQARLDLAPLLADGGAPADAPVRCEQERNRPFDRGELAERMVRDALPAVEAKTGGAFHYPIRNFNRSIGARLSGEIARRHGN